MRIYKFLLISTFISSSLFPFSEIKFKKSQNDYFLNCPSSNERITDDYITENNNTRLGEAIFPLPEISLVQKKHSFVPNKQYLKYFFSNLENNMIFNNDGICGYVTIAMLLSYYDNYWNNSFIDSSFSLNQSQSIIYNGDDLNYFYQSPGVKDYGLYLEDYYNGNFEEHEFIIEGSQYRKCIKCLYREEI